MTYDGNTDRPIFIDIDGTLTDHPEQHGKAIPERIEHIRRLVSRGQSVVIWSGGGTLYARNWVTAHGLAGIVTAIGKPETVVDDNPDIRPKGRMPIVSPQDFFN